MEATLSASVYLALLGAMATLVRLGWSGIWRRYGWFTAWTVSNILKSGVLSYVSATYGIGSQDYATTWRYCHTVTSILLVGAGIEAYLRIANDYPRIGDYGRRVLAWSSLAALVFALMPMGMDTLTDRLNNNTVAVGVLVRSSAIAVGLGLAFAVSHIRSVPIPERKNLFYHRWLLMAYCAGQAAGMTLMVFTGERQWALIYMGTAAVCWCLWPFLLTGKGEELVRRDFSDDDRHRITAAVEDLRNFAIAASEESARNRARQ